MPRLLIDNQPIEVPPGSTILDAARELGKDIPALCYLEGHPPLTSCMVCLVKVKGRHRPVPSCATPVEEGMEVESESAEVWQLRRTGLELLLSDHVGDCTAPCQNACPADVDIPLMLGQIAAGHLREAVATVKRDLALPAILSRVCPKVCEKGCRLGLIGSSVLICRVMRYVAETDLASEAPHLSPCEPATGKQVVIVGSGPTGLAAAYHLLQAGHSCTIFEESVELGGILRTEFDEDQLPRHILEDEIALIEKLGARFCLDRQIGGDSPLAELCGRFDAVLLAVGSPVEDSAERLGLRAEKGRLVVDRRTHQADLPGVFAAGRAVRPAKLVVRDVSDGKAAALCIEQYLAGAAVTGPPRTFGCRVGRVGREDVERLAAAIGHGDLATPPRASGAVLSPAEAEMEARRCLQCACGAREACKLRHYAEMYGAAATRLRGQQRALERLVQHDHVVYEPGKCIRCGRCVRIAEAAGEPLGLSLVGRGFDVRVDVPFDRSLAEGLLRAAKRCAEACPTGALALRVRGGDGQAPGER